MMMVTKWVAVIIAIAIGTTATSPIVMIIISLGLHS